MEINPLYIITISWIIGYVISMSCLNALIKKDIITRNKVQSVPPWLFYLISFMIVPIYIIPAIITWIAFFLLFLNVRDYELTWSIIADSLHKNK